MERMYRLMKQCIKRICCLLTGGHMFEHRDISEYDKNSRVYTVTEVCSKCGKEVSFLDLNREWSMSYINREILNDLEGEEGEEKE